MFCSSVRKFAFVLHYISTLYLSLSLNNYSLFISLLIYFCITTFCFWYFLNFSKILKIIFPSWKQNLAPIWWFSALKKKCCSKFMFMLFHHWNSNSGIWGLFVLSWFTVCSLFFYIQNSPNYDTINFVKFQSSPALKNHLFSFKVWKQWTFINFDRS